LSNQNVAIMWLLETYFQYFHVHHSRYIVWVTSWNFNSMQAIAQAHLFLFT
jgi:hypothetical protein